MDPILRVVDLTKRFGGLSAVDRCSLSVRRGTITGLIGPNGAGKTTLFNLLTGFLRPDHGRVLFEDADITGLRPWQVFRRGICRTFQIPREFSSSRSTAPTWPWAGTSSTPTPAWRSSASGRGCTSRP